MENVFTATTKEALLEELEKRSINVDTSIALTFLFGIPKAKDLEVIRQASKLCDVVVTAVDSVKVAERLPPILQPVGVDILFTPKNLNNLCSVDAGLKKGPNATFMMQSILLTLPNVVMTNKTNMPQVRTLRNFQHTFGHFFSLRLVD